MKCGSFSRIIGTVNERAHRKAYSQIVPIKTQA